MYFVIADNYKIFNNNYLKRKRRKNKCYLINFCTCSFIGNSSALWLTDWLSDTYTQTHTHHRRGRGSNRIINNKLNKQMWIFYYYGRISRSQMKWGLHLQLRLSISTTAKCWQTAKIHKYTSINENVNNSLRLAISIQVTPMHIKHFNVGSYAKPVILAIATCSLLIQLNDFLWNNWAVSGFETQKLCQSYGYGKRACRKQNEALLVKGVPTFKYHATRIANTIYATFCSQ